jgi:hypothetical protein
MVNVWSDHFVSMPANHKAFYRPYKLMANHDKRYSTLSILS